MNKKCACQVLVDKSGKVCGRVMAGLNSTNVKAHLKAFHKDTFVALEEKEKEREAKQRKVTLIPVIPGQHCDSTATTDSSTKPTNFLKAPQKWAADSFEKKKRDAALVDMVVGCGLPVTTVGKPSFIEFCTTLDPRYEVPSVGKFNKLLNQKYSQCKKQVLAALKSARRVTIGMDIWTKKGYTSSYLGITACFFDPTCRKAVHALLNLYTINHPHTGEMISKKFADCLTEWHIEPRRVFLLITDNASDMTKPAKVLNWTQASEQVEYAADTDAASAEDSEDDESELESLERNGEEPEVEVQNNRRDDDNFGQSGGHDTGLAQNCDSANSVADTSLITQCEADGGPYEGEYVPIQFEESFRYKRLQCVVHTLQLSLKVLDECETFTNIASEARSLVEAVRCSSVATQQLVRRAGKTVIVGCSTTTGWSSSYLMFIRLVELQTHLRIVCSEVGLDCLSNSQWAKVENIVKLLRPFTEHTDTLQSDCSSLSSVIPVILDLMAHLKQSPEKILARVLLSSLTDRFDRYLRPANPDFDVTPATACLLSPDVAHFLMTEPLLFEAAKYNALDLLVASATEVYRR